MDRSYSPKTMVFVFALMGPKTFPFLMLKKIILNFDFAHCQSRNDIVGKFIPFTNKILMLMNLYFLTIVHMVNLITSPTSKVSRFNLH